MVYRNFILILIALTLFSCTLPKGWNWKRTPRPYWGMDNMPPNNTEYGRGFEQGCTHGLFVASKGAMSEALKRKRTIDTDSLLNSPEFYTGYYDGYEQCTYILDWDVV